MIPVVLCECLEPPGTTDSFTTDGGYLTAMPVVNITGNATVSQDPDGSLVITAQSAGGGPPGSAGGSARSATSLINPSTDAFCLCSDIEASEVASDPPPNQLQSGFVVGLSQPVAPFQQIVVQSGGASGANLGLIVKAAGAPFIFDLGVPGVDGQRYDIRICHLPTDQPNEFRVSIDGVEQVVAVPPPTVPTVALPTVVSGNQLSTQPQTTPNVVRSRAYCANWGPLSPG